ncbi:hypothetical protein J7S27_03610 [Carnobacteriaceae bacterium zg-C25]|nr:hypothetical protein J7S27_03610 [Carnobacteriaceae bacterium zg-C25]
MRECMMCQKVIRQSTKWASLFLNDTDNTVCEACLKDAELYQQALKDYLERNEYHLRFYLSCVLKKHVPLKHVQVLTKGYKREKINLYDEAYAICCLLISCASLTPTILNYEMRPAKHAKKTLVIGFDDTCDVNLFRLVNPD